MSRRAFTLLELTVVLTIAGLLIALAVPRFAVLRDSASVRAATGELGAMFSAARQEAIARRAPVAVRVDAAAGVVELRAGRVSLARRTLAATYGVTLTSTRDSTVYDPRGIGFGLSNLTVTVRRGEMVDSLTMSRLGRVRW